MVRNLGVADTTSRGDQCRRLAGASRKVYNIPSPTSGLRRIGWRGLPLGRQHEPAGPTSPWRRAEYTASGGAWWATAFRTIRNGYAGPVTAAFGRGTPRQQRRKDRRSYASSRCHRNPTVTASVASRDRSTKWHSNSIFWKVMTSARRQRHGGTGLTTADCRRVAGRTLPPSGKAGNRTTRIAGPGSGTHRSRPSNKYYTTRERRFAAALSAKRAGNSAGQRHRCPKTSGWNGGLGFARWAMVRCVQRKFTGWVCHRRAHDHRPAADRRPLRQRLERDAAGPPHYERTGAGRDSSGALGAAASLGREWRVQQTESVKAAQRRRLMATTTHSHQRHYSMARRVGTRKWGSHGETNRRRLCAAQFRHGRVTGKGSTSRAVGYNGLILIRESYANGLSRAARTWGLLGYHLNGSWCAAMNGSAGHDRQRRHRAPRARTFSRISGTATTGQSLRATGSR